MLRADVWHMNAVNWLLSMATSIRQCPIWVPGTQLLHLYPAFWKAPEKNTRVSAIPMRDPDWGLDSWSGPEPPLTLARFWRMHLSIWLVCMCVSAFPVNGKYFFKDRTQRNFLMCLINHPSESIILILLFNKQENSKCMQWNWSLICLFFWVNQP